MKLPESFRAVKRLPADNIGRYPPPHFIGATSEVLKGDLESDGRFLLTFTDQNNQVTSLRAIEIVQQIVNLP